MSDSLNYPQQGRGASGREQDVKTQILMELARIEGDVLDLQQAVREDRPVKEQVERVTAAMTALRDVVFQIIDRDLEANLDGMLGTARSDEITAALHDLVRKTSRKR